MSSLDPGASTLLFDYLGLERDARLLIVADSEQVELANYLASVARHRDVVSEAIVSKNFADLIPKLGRSDVVLYALGQDSLHSEELLDYIRCSPRPQQRFYRAFDCTPSLLEQCFNVSRADLEDLNARLLTTLSRAATVRISSRAGTDLRMRFQENRAWVSSNGVFDGVLPGILPPGEVATFSTDVDGVLVADGAINTNFGFPGDVRCAQWPITIDVTRGKARLMDCPNAMARRLIEHLLTHPLARNVGELGFGTNYGISAFVPFVSHINERRSTFHMGLGAHLQDEASAVGWSFPMHLDLILGECDIFADERLIHRNHSYYLESLDTPNSTPSSLRVKNVDTL